MITLCKYDAKRGYNGGDTVTAAVIPC